MATITASILIVGAHGRLGWALTQAFAQAGWRVVACARRPLPALPGNVRLLIADMHDASALLALLGGQRIDVLAHAINPLYTEWPQHALALHEQVLWLAGALNASVLFPGNLYNYGKPIPAKLSAETPVRGNTEKGRIRLEMERALTQAPQSIVLRAGDFFGGSQPGTWLDQLIAKDLPRGVLHYPGRLDVAHAWAYLPDLARTFVQLAERRTTLPAHSDWLFAGHTLTGEVLCQTLQWLVGRPLPIKREPLWLWRVLGLAHPMLRELSHMSYLWTQPHQLDDSALRALLGELPHTTLTEALSASLPALQGQTQHRAYVGQNV